MSSLNDEDEYLLMGNISTSMHTIWIPPIADLKFQSIQYLDVGSQVCPAANTCCANPTLTTGTHLSLHKQAHAHIHMQTHHCPTIAGHSS